MKSQSKAKLITLFSLILFFWVFGFVKISLAATINAASCSYSDVSSAISSANAGDTVIVPAGSCTWTTTNNVTINKQITLKGNGIDSTIITTNGTSYQSVLTINTANVTVRDFTFISTDGSLAYPIQITATASSFRIAYNKFTGTSGYAIDVRTAYGLIDHNSITFTIGSSQPINVRGPSDSWQTEATIEGADNVFLEDNIFTSDNKGYPVCSTNARCVFRYNTMGPTKIDMHGECTGNPGVRHYEIYNNTWLDYPGYYMAFDIRGGTGRIFNNVATKTTGALWFNLDEHAANHTYCAGYSPNCGCTAPLNHQIGVGKDPKVRASEPLYIWGNTKNGAYWPAAIVTNVTLCAIADQCGTGFAMSTILTEELDFFNSETKPAAMDSYTPYTYPHPLTITADVVAPTITAFTIPSTASSSTISISSFTATDDTAVTGYLVNESASTPSAGDAGWASTAQAIYTFLTEGLKTLYAWVKDAAGNISSSLSRTVTIILDSTAPVRSAGSPSDSQSAGTMQVTMSLTTDENSTCKYSTTASTTYSSMTNIFSTTASTSHSSIISVSNGNSYNYYVRCTDGTNINSDDYTISFSVASPSTSSSSGGGGGGGGGGSSISSDSSTQTSTTTSISTSAIASTTIATSTSAIVATTSLTSVEQKTVSSEQTQTVQPIAEIVNHIFIRNLAFGERSEDVKHLQEILAQDKEIYPEGIISGYYGFLTQKAVERFQIKRQIVSSGTMETTGFGLVGPLTRTKINEVFGKNEKIIQPSTTTEQQISISTTEQPIADVQSQIVNSQQISEIKEQIKQFQTLLVSLLRQLVEIILQQETEKMIP